MIATVKQKLSSLNTLLWLTDLADLPAWQARVIRIIRVLFAVGRDIAEGQLTLRAMGLVYTTLLSLVPLLAVSFSVVKAFGGHNLIEPMLAGVLEPLGQQGVEVTNNILAFVDNMKVGVLGAVGVGMLFYTVVSLMQKIEDAFNYTWRVGQVRPLSQRFSDYLSVLMIGPVLVFSALGMTGTVMNASVVQWMASIEPFGTLLQFGTRLLPYMMIIGAFTFVYVFIPNTKVKVGSALIGALVAGVLWQTAGWFFASFIANSGQYAAVYSAFATLIILLIWLYLGWLILLTGASVAFYHQNPDFTTAPQRELLLSNNLKERLALGIMTRIGERHYQDQVGCQCKDLALTFNVPSDIIARVLRALEDTGLVKQSNDKSPLYLPAKPLEEMSVKSVLDAVRYANENDHLNSQRLPSNPQLDKVFNDIDDSTTSLLANQTVKDLVQRATAS